MQEHSHLFNELIHAVTARIASKAVRLIKLWHVPQAEARRVQPLPSLIVHHGPNVLQRVTMVVQKVHLCLCSQCTSQLMRVRLTKLLSQLTEHVQCVEHLQVLFDFEVRKVGIVQKDGELVLNAEPQCRSKLLHKLANRCKIVLRCRCATVITTTAVVVRETRSIKPQNDFNDFKYWLILKENIHKHKHIIIIIV